VAYPDVDDEAALRALSARYASAADRRDVAAFLTIFDEEARLRVFDPSSSATPRTDRRGRDALAAIPKALERYASTFHLVGNALYDVTGDEATGEVYCLAHHLSAEHTDHVMLIRYGDRYRKVEGRWLIVDRRVQVDWRETRPTVRPAE